MGKPYTASELVQMLKDRQGGLTQQQYAVEIGVSPQFLSNVYNGIRSPGCEEILKYLAPRNKKFIEQIVWELVGL